MAPVLSEPQLLQRAARLLEAGQPEQARAILEPAVEARPDSARLQSLLGTARFLDRKYLTAEDSLAKAVDLGQRDLRTLYFYASALWENGHLDRSEALCREAIERHGEQVPLTHLLGRLLLWQGRYDEAAAWLERAARRSAGSVDLWLDFAGALEGSGRDAEALAALDQAIALAPEHYQVRYARARVLRKGGDREGAARELGTYRELLEEDQRRTLEKGRMRAQIDLAYDLARRGVAADALAQLDSLPLSAETLIARADIAQQSGDRETMLRALEQAVALDPGRAELRARLATARMAEEDED